jgi:ribosomal-protein-alanine N-acetyltransferase
MPQLQRLAPEHAGEVLRFELENRAYFARAIADRGDDYFERFPQRHAAVLAEQAAGGCHLHVLVDDDGRVLGRFNLFDVAGGSAELGYRVAERATGRGVAKDGVRRVIGLARDEYGLSRLTAGASADNAASLAVLRACGFVVVGPSKRGGVLHRLDLS